eukprot:02542.XXX_28540_28665_1 [CDS] Oithona nana genome sequencing.
MTIFLFKKPGLLFICFFLKLKSVKCFTLCKSFFYSDFFFAS